MYQSNADLVRKLYQAREADDEESIRSCLADDILWHEPDLESGPSGDLRGPEAVLAMIRRATELTGGTFRLHPREVVENGEHAVALVEWPATQNTQKGASLEGREVAVYWIPAARIVEASFHQGDPELDRRFWEQDS